MPRLFIVPTPIGNLEDLSFRSLRVLKEVSLVLAEDTRHTRKLFSRYSIATRLQSYHQHNKLASLDGIVRILETEDIALVSNAGMPVISDPGFELIRAARERSIPVEVLPGPNAAVTAVVASAIPCPGFLFLGFLPRKSGERRSRLQEVAPLPYSIVIYEAPHRLLNTLLDIRAICGDREIAIARELTKVHEEIVKGPTTEVLAHFQGVHPKGEVTVVVGPGEATQVDLGPVARDELLLYRDRGVDARTAQGEVAAKYGLSRNAVYRLWLDCEKE